MNKSLCEKTNSSSLQFIFATEVNKTQRLQTIIKGLVTGDGANRSKESRLLTCIPLNSSQQDANALVDIERGLSTVKAAVKEKCFPTWLTRNFLGLCEQQRCRSVH